MRPSLELTKSPINSLTSKAELNSGGPMYTYILQSEQKQDR